MDQMELTAAYPNELQKAISLAERNIFMNYLEELDDPNAWSICAPTQTLLDETSEKCLRLFRLTRLTCKKGEDVLQKLENVYHAATALGCSVYVILDAPSGEEPARLYLGIRDPSIRFENLSPSASALEKGLLSNFPGSELEQLGDHDEIADIFRDGGSVVSAVSCVAGQRDKSQTEDKGFVQGVEKLIDTMHGRAFTAVIIAEPLSGPLLSDIRAGYESLYSDLSFFRKETLSFNASQTHSEMKNFGIGLSKSITKSTSKSQSTSHSNTKGSSNSDTAGHYLGSNIQIPLFGASIGGGISKSKTEGTNESRSDSTSQTDGSSESEANTGSANITVGDSDALTQGNALQLERVNKSVEEMLRRIDEQLKRLQECERYGAYRCSAYFLTGNPQDNLLAANTYRALMLGDSDSTHGSGVNLWRNDKDTDLLKEYLCRFAHPIFSSVDNESFRISAAPVVSGAELPLYLGLPRRSVPGLPVIRHAEFGRSVPEPESPMRLGSLFHMGQCDPSSAIQLDRNSLTMHTFVTGSTGAGKSNTIYTMLRELCLDGDARFLVVEPAKGEYKLDLGGYPGVTVYGTNPKKTRLLRLNPFAFPEDTHVLEHIDRLVEVFNACWPMYAAMPAVLKDAMEASYECCGWSLTDSENPAGTFPTFGTLLKKLPAIMEQSAYSANTKGDYIGALVTRVKSLTNGINGQIFCAEQGIPDDELFDQNVIVDLSRVGSPETKALVMGVLMIRMQEYRMSRAEESNAKLHHITVLEEAHNLLRRTSAEQSQESSNLQGKSVEMLSNAIAEMRTYGEGFIIADQAPGLLDMAAIRNTNTKIILRLPDESDRRLVGTAAGLDDDQIAELAKLEKGVAAVYQNDWLEPVLCKVDPFIDKRPYSFKMQQPEPSPHMEAWLAQMLYGVNDGRELQQEEIEQIHKWIDRLDTNTNAKETLRRTLDPGKTTEKEELAWAIYCALKGKSLLERAEQIPDVEVAGKVSDKRIMETLQVSPSLACEIRKTVFTYAADQMAENEPRRRDLLRYGGVLL